MNDPKLQDCPVPGCEGKVKRLLGTGAGLIFKGAGFYQNDYRSNSYQQGAKKDSESSSPAKSSDSGGGGSSSTPAPAAPSSPPPSSSSSAS